ncbi:hypothetical protein ACHJH3_06450 [Campylobacter sp. MOP7]|uniref:hypothetical protein n=1 Tax=Campylobacter canis TaxID=3378588 RepID=UPI00387E237F
MAKKLFISSEIAHGILEESCRDPKEGYRGKRGHDNFLSDYLFNYAIPKWGKEGDIEGMVLPLSGKVASRYNSSIKLMEDGYPHLARMQKMHVMPNARNIAFGTYVREGENGSRNVTLFTSGNNVKRDIHQSSIVDKTYYLQPGDYVIINPIKEFDEFMKLPSIYRRYCDDKEAVAKLDDEIMVLEQQIMSPDLSKVDKEILQLTIKKKKEVRKDIGNFSYSYFTKLKFNYGIWLLENAKLIGWFTDSNKVYANHGESFFFIAKILKHSEKSSSADGFVKNWIEPMSLFRYDPFNNGFLDAYIQKVENLLDENLRGTNTDDCGQFLEIAKEMNSFVNSLIEKKDISVNQNGTIKYPKRVHLHELIHIALKKYTILASKWEYQIRTPHIDAGSSLQNSSVTSAFCYSQEECTTFPNLLDLDEENRFHAAKPLAKVDAHKLSAIIASGMVRAKEGADKQDVSAKDNILLEDGSLLRIKMTKKEERIAENVRDHLGNRVTLFDRIVGYSPVCAIYDPSIKFANSFEV